MSATSTDQHFEGKDRQVRATYDAVLRVARRCGKFVEDPKKTSIHLVARTAFAGVQTRKTKIVLTIKSSVEVKDARADRCEQLSANRWHFQVHLNTPADVDSTVERWLASAYEIST